MTFHLIEQTVVFIISQLECQQIPSQTLQLVPLLVFHLLHQLVRAVGPHLKNKKIQNNSVQLAAYCTVIVHTLASSFSCSALSSTSLSLFPRSPAIRRAFAISLSPLILSAYNDWIKMCSLCFRVRLRVQLSATKTRPYCPLVAKDWIFYVLIMPFALQCSDLKC